MPRNLDARQTDASIGKNISFFRDHLQAYKKDVQELDTYVVSRQYTNEAIRGIRRLLDIGNGGVFDYDVSLVSDLLALDLSLDHIDTSSYPSHIRFKTGSALSIPEPDASFDGVLMVMLAHHLIGKTVSESIENVRTAVREAMRVLRPGGKLILVESCVPAWFYAFEKMVFPLASRIIQKILPHPATLQYPAKLIEGLMAAHHAQVEVTRIPKGWWILQYGYKFPAFLTPAAPHRLVVHKPG